MTIIETIINDTHIGPSRQGGTTPASRDALKIYVRSKFKELVDHSTHRLTILGDLFDKFEVDSVEVLTTYITLKEWLDEDSSRHLRLVAGNHDIGKRNDRLSSFHFLAGLLLAVHKDRVTLIDTELVSVQDNVHIIPHCMNQDLFNAELEKAKSLPDGWLLLHANLANGFAENSDHSLNVSYDQAKELSVKHHLVFAHEHQARTVNFGHKDIYVLGNQIPTSIADCLPHGPAQQDGKKYMHFISDEGITAQEVWDSATDYCEMPWDNLVETEARFIRISGTAKADQAPLAVNVVSDYRQYSDAFVVTNNIVIESDDELGRLSELSLDSITRFDVKSALLEQLDPRESALAERLLAL